MPILDKLLIANRGEIALRIQRTCHAMGISTVAVYADVDADAPYVRAADEAIALGAGGPGETYLQVDKLVAAARATGAHAIHPGYGFLSEDPRLAEACAAAGVIFVGPSAQVIRQLGSKREAKALAASVGVPVLPGYAGPAQTTEELVAEARALGAPLLVKASAGGGGKGMHVLREGDDLAAAIDRARREACSAFGDGALLLERYLERPRHLEVQLLGDHHGNLIHLHERECSIQRRHQKILEEAPAAALPASTRAALGAAAVALGRAVGYTSAGTVEFIVDQEGAFYFLEVNTRLQVEHPVTELICDVDLVAEQLRVARGEPLRLSGPPPARGHAIEVRLCAEDATRDFLPASGEFLALDVPQAPHVRCDLGAAAGAQLGTHYDSMVGKIIAHGETRAEAAARLRRALSGALVAGVTTNLGLLVRLLAHPAFLAGELDTHFLVTHARALRSSPSEEVVADAAVAATLAGLARRRAARQLPAVAPGWRNVPSEAAPARFTFGARTLEVRYRSLDEERVVLTVDGRERRIARYRLVEAAGAVGAATLEVVLEPSAGDAHLGDGLAGHRRTFRLAEREGRWWLATGGETVLLVEAARFPEPLRAVPDGSVLAPMPGRVVRVLVAVGDAVEAGQPIVILEAMKMEHTLRVAQAGAVSSLDVAVGDQVTADQLLAVVA
ncbi:MAG: biotin carboxylase N-terminal domain-containing protein [Kofleriaceae bacterium]